MPEAELPAKLSRDGRVSPRRVSATDFGGLPELFAHRDDKMRVLARPSIFMPRQVRWGGTDVLMGWCAEIVRTTARVRLLHQ